MTTGLNMVLRSGENDLTRDVLNGRTLGDYHIERRIGGGATSDVFLAKQSSLGRYVALKILKDELASDETYVKRFLQEARAAARLEHPNIVRIYEVGELTDERRSKAGGWFSRRFPDEKKYRFIAQEYVDGMSLAQYLRRNGPTSIMQTFAALEQIASALKRASDLNVVHRDVKPENILIDSSGVLKVVDFGLARMTDSLGNSWESLSLTQTGLALGTPLYMSPEQARGQKIDSRADVYSLGVTAYRMLTGVTPFSGESPLAVVLKHLNEEARPIAQTRTDAPEALASLIHRMLAKDPNDRPCSMADLLAEIRAARREYVASLSEGAEATSETFGELVGSENLALNTAEARQDQRGNKKGAEANAHEKKGDFFPTNKERDSFQRTLRTSSLSRDLQEGRAKLDEALKRSNAVWTRRRVVLATLTTVVAFLIGGGVLFVKNRWVASLPVEPPLTIQQFDSVEEQYVFALQLGTIDAWKSVYEYFPDDEYWKLRAQKQLALVYVGEKDFEEASKLFQDLASDPNVGRPVDPFALAGLAWVSASKGDYDAAAATLSELNDVKRFDYMTLDVLSKTHLLFQNRYGNNFDDWFRFNWFGRQNGRIFGETPGGEPNAGR